MSVLRDSQKLSAALLLCLVAAFTVSPPEYHRTHNTSRTRPARSLRLDDHDLDHTPGAALSGERTAHPDSNPLTLAVLPGILNVQAPPGPPGAPVVNSAALLPSFSCPIRAGRAPPSL